jgi:hypothetical protein
MLSAVGWPAPSAATIVIARDGGVLMLALAIVDWVGRSATGPLMLGLLWANLFVRVVGAIVNAWEFAVGLTPSSVAIGLAGALGIDIALIAVFVLALRRGDWDGPNSNPTA